MFVYLLFHQANDRSGVYRLAMLGFIQLMPFMVAFSRMKFDFISFILLNHFATYTFGRLNKMANLGEGFVIPLERIHAIDEMLNCTILIILGYYTFRFLLFHGFFDRAKYEMLPVSKRLMVFIAMYAVAMPLMIRFVPSQLLTIHFALASADLVLLFTTTIRNHERLASFLRGLALLSAIYYFLKTGALSAVGSFAAFYFITTCLKRKYLNLLWMVPLVVMASAVQTVKNDFRLYLRSNPQASMTELFQQVSTLLEENYQADDSSNYDEEIEEEFEGQNSTSGKLSSGLARLGDDSLEVVLAKTPSEVPFWNGETYHSIPYMFIPRAIWPEKPTRHFWNKFGRTYGFLSDNDYQTSVAVAFLAEAYMNFGFLGMYSLALMFGVVVVVVERFSYYVLNGHYLFSFVVLLMPLSNYAQDLGTTINALVLIIVLLMGLRPFLMKISSRDDYGSFY